MQVLVGPDSRHVINVDYCAPGLHTPVAFIKIQRNNHQWRIVNVTVIKGCTLLLDNESCATSTGAHNHFKH